MTQPDSYITVSERSRLELRCNYSSPVSLYLFWHMQYPNQGLQLLLKYESGDNLVSGIKGFEAELRRSEKSFHLRKIPAHWKDSAKYFCVLSDTVPGTAGGAEHKPQDTVAQPLLCLVSWQLCEGEQDRQCRILEVFGSHGHLRFFFSSFFLVFSILFYLSFYKGKTPVF